MKFLQKFENYLRASYPALYVQTHEEKRLQQDLASFLAEKAAISEGSEEGTYNLYTWNLSEGLRNLATGELLGADTAIPSDVPLHIMRIPRLNNAIFLLNDFHLVVDKPLVIRRFRNLWDNLKARNSMVVFTGCKLVLPSELEKEVQLLDYDLPQVEAIGERLNFILASANHSRVEADLTPFEISPEIFDSAVQAAKGMTYSEIENTFALCATTAKGFNSTFVEHVFEEKITQFKKNGLLTYIPSDVSFERVGGLAGLKSWLRGRKKAYTKEAKEYGLPLPKGCLFCSVPGVGKTMLAKATAKEFDCPLFSFDIGNIFDSHVGNSERNMREAIKTIESIGKCVILIDEIEKSLSENAVSGKGDTGVSSRIYGTFLSWLNDRTNPAFLIATSNNHTLLPSPLIRKGRFDQLFWIDLPSTDERSEIFNVVIEKYGRSFVDFDVAAFTELSEDYTGAEIEEIFKSALFRAFDRGEEVHDGHVIEEFELFIPFAISHAEDLQIMRDQAQGKLVMLSSEGETEKVEDGIRKLRI
jgi:ATP-dependent 26S proteasome regulatory subunit